MADSSLICSLKGFNLAYLFPIWAEIKLVCSLAAKLKLHYPLCELNAGLFVPQRLIVWLVCSQAADFYHLIPNRQNINSFFPRKSNFGKLVPQLPKYTELIPKELIICITASELFVLHPQILNFPQ